MTQGRKPSLQYEALKILWESRNKQTNEVNDPCVFLRSHGLDAPSVIVRHLEKKGFLVIDNKHRSGGLHGGTILAVSFTQNGIAKICELCGGSLETEKRGNDPENEQNGALNGAYHTPPASSSINLIPARGRGALQKNLQAVLRALWNVAKNGVVNGPKQILEQHISAPLTYLNHLERAGCIEMTVSGGRGKKIERIRLLKHFLPEPGPSVCKTNCFAPKRSPDRRPHAGKRF